MSARRAALTAMALCLAVVALIPAAAQAAPAPAWSLRIFPMPANFEPGKGAEYLVIATNVGAGPTTAQPSKVEVTLPPGLAPSAVEGKNFDPAATTQPTCTKPPFGQVVSCETTEPVGPGRRLMVKVTVAVSASPGTLVTKATASGGGATSTPEVSFPTAIQAAPLPFDFLPGFAAPITEEDGEPSKLAGSHPYQQTLSFAFPTKRPGSITNDGHPRNISVELPKGLLGNPAASSVLCTEAELTDDSGCPNPSQVGSTEVTSLLGEAGNNVVFTDNLYNMVPPPGAVAELATDVNVAGLFVHILIGVRSDGDYGVEARIEDSLAFGIQPIFAVQSQIWGDPSATSHDEMRGDCVQGPAPECEVDPAQFAFLSLPADCPQVPLPFEVRADSWEEPSPPFAERVATYAAASLTGTPVSVEDCGGLAFEPTIAAQPTTNLTDSPSGLDFNLHQAQNTDPAPARSTAPLKDASITFPPGFVVNPAQAAGLGACSEAQVGFTGAQGGALHFSKAPQSCPDAAKLGTLTATSPALVRRNAQHEVELQAGEPVLEALNGALYLAEPFANPFDTLAAVYLVVEDEKTGIVAKLAGKADLDPQSGQITTRFAENPQLPLEDLKAHLFGGERGSFITPPTCGPHTTTSQLTPWSAPEGKDAAPSAVFGAAAAPTGGPCPATEAQLPAAAKLSAGTLNPAAAKYSPLLFKLSRADGTQRLARIEATLPTGLAAKLAGVGSCSEAQIAKARAREVPDGGAAEQADPSCPAASRIGTATAAVGAGPTPYYTSANVYLAGPYKGAPLSVVAIAPAVAGPFDLGAVVIRSALYLDPSTAQARIVSDPLPQILEGVPVDLRSVAVRVDRPGFSLNPTSCDQKSFGGALTTTLGTLIPISERFQVGGCKSLPYKPKLTASLAGPIHRGGHPSFRAVLTAKPGEANSRSFSLTLPKSEFIDQAHFRTICTRVQYAANQCPAGSIYGYVKAKSPLVDYTLQGPIYLRSSSHKLPDAVAALHGPPSQPIAIDAVARIDSVNGGLRSRVQTVPDAPISKVIVSLQGGKKGLFQNSTNICKGIHRMAVSFTGQNGKVADTTPALKAKCPKPKPKGKGGGAKKR
jgi:hypothetical protein